jgi:hypothetical protein
MAEWRVLDTSSVWDQDGVECVLPFAMPARYQPYFEILQSQDVGQAVLGDLEAGMCISRVRGSLTLSAPSSQYATDVELRLGSVLESAALVPGGSVTITIPETVLDSPILPGDGAWLARILGPYYEVGGVEGTYEFTIESLTAEFYVEPYSPPASEEGVRSEAFVDIRYSKDGGRNWSHWKRRSLGEVGDFMKRVRVNRLGRGRQWVFDIRVTDDCRADLLAASVKVEGE